MAKSKSELASRKVNIFKYGERIDHLNADGKRIRSKFIKYDKHGNFLESYWRTYIK